MKLSSAKVVAFAVPLVLLVTSEAQARQVCASNVRVVEVVQGDPAFGDERDIGIVVVDSNGTRTKFSSTDWRNVGESPEARTLLSMALAAQSSQMPTNVISANCTVSSGWIKKWIGLNIVAS
ncbi:hypothetical protein KRZ98_17705 [Sphingobium sp. AS12]|uniref:hypothetical protein n=1 Tax=Sphingobium sp. AS12 TaxID=2849495 RepID=UPI001C315E0D|nr:hypothetical protein [Sphingobium sp. AS12]MBV2150081.1 hypothetical protein [Sphingobium sp. AS12]